MALTFFWRCESADVTESVAAGLDYVRGTEFTPFAANSVSLSTSAARVGRQGILHPAGTAAVYQWSTAGWEPILPNASTSDPSTSFGSAAFSVYFVGVNNVFRNNFGVRFIGSVSANNNISGSIGTSPSSMRPGFGVQDSVNGRYDIYLNTNLVAGTWYGIVYRWDFPNLKLKIELYDSNGQLIEENESLSTDFSVNIPSELGSLFGCGVGGSTTTSDVYFDNFFVADTYDEPLQRFFTIDNYNDYINNIGFQDRGLSLSKKYVTRTYLEQCVGSIQGNSNMIFGWGKGNAGRLGNLSASDRSSPVSVVGGVGWIKVTAGSESYSLGLKSDGTLWGWGNNNLGLLGDGTTTNKSSPVSVVGGLSWKDVSAGKYTSFGITRDGQLWSWGQGPNGVKGDNTTTSTSSPGTISGGGTTWKQVSCGTLDSAAAVKVDGTLWTWGSNNNGQLGDNTTVNKSSPITVAGGGTTWKQVSAGASSCGAVKTDGTLWTWGNGANGQTGKGSTTSVSSPTTTSGGGNDWKTVSFNYRNNGAIKTDGSLWMWGKNESGGVGDGTTINRLSPSQVAGGGYNWKSLAVGPFQLDGDNAFAVKTDGTLWAWGYNLAGQLGDNTTVSKSSPISVMTSDWIRWSSVGQGSGDHIQAIIITDSLSLFRK